MAGWQDFQGVNAGYVAELYERFREHPETVDPATRELFARWVPTDTTGPRPAAPSRARRRRCRRSSGRSGSPSPFGATATWRRRSTRWASRPSATRR